ncbi:MAG: DUF1573 domain-containing protein [Flavobacteriales bacterium]|jgi:hypothetical protein|nr:DUF1573 domain-containing protein [Flavobacteriales bacterium]
MKLQLAMKQILTACLMVFGMLAATVAQDLTSGPSISLDKDVHDYGTITQGADGGCEFTVTNGGTDPLIMSRCKGSCGCTVPKCDKDPIMPGTTSVISVRYDTKRIGPINKSVTITSNAVNEPTKVIRIKGKVEAGDANEASGAPLKPAAAGAPVNKE